MTTLTERLARCYTGAVHDVLRMMGELSAQTLAARGVLGFVVGGMDPVDAYNRYGKF